MMIYRGLLSRKPLGAFFVTQIPKEHHSGHAVFKYIFDLYFLHTVKC